MREFSVPIKVEVPPSANLTDPVWANAQEFPDKVQFELRGPGGTWQPITMREFRDEVTAVARGLIAAGVQPGDRIGLISGTRYEWTLVDYALWAVGAVTVTIFDTSSAEQVEWILSNSNASACFVETPAHEAIVRSLHDQLPNVKKIWQIDAGALEELKTAGESVNATEVEERRKSVTGDDIATIIYTSGTTGRAKGCVLTHHNIYFDITNGTAGLAAVFNDDSRILLFLPLAHSLARLIQVGAIQVRATLGHVNGVKTLVEDFGTYKPTFVLSVPRVFEKVYNGAKIKAHADGKGKIFDAAEATAIAYSESLDQGGPGLGLRLKHGLFDKLVYSKIRNAMGGACRNALSGGAPLGARLAHFFRGIGVTIYEGYGLTETSPGAAFNTEGAIKVGTVGQPLPGTSIRIADDDEVLIYGPHVFQQYWENPEATAEAIDSEGWFHSGDLGELDEDGYLTITGRKKDLIVTAGGKNVAPAVLEDRLRAHALISQCMVVGDRQPFVGALITIDADVLPGWKERHGKPAEATLSELRADAELMAEVQAAVDDANRAVSRAESIRKFTILENDFSEAEGTMTPSLKIKRNVIAKEYADEIAALYT